MLFCKPLSELHFSKKEIKIVWFLIATFIANGLETVCRDLSYGKYVR